MSISRFLGQRWFQILGVGALLFFGSEQALKITGNPNFVPTVILLGAFVVPAAFIAYFSTQEIALDRAAHTAVPFSLLFSCFLIGGVIGTVLAGIIEYATLTHFSIPTLFGVAAVEEAAKLIFPIALFIRGRYRSEADGLLFGVTAGMGFAALETMGYGLVALVNSQGDITALEETLLIRGLLSPVGHAAWTGLVCAVLWRQRERTGKSFSLAVLGVFILAVVLHAGWDIGSGFNQVYIAYIGYGVIGAISLTLLILRLRDARRSIPSVV